MNDLAKKTRLERRHTILDLEKHIKKMDQVEIEPVHYFAPGVYAREITIKAGTILTGKIHLTEHLNIISKGRILIVTEEGNREVEAPCTIISKPGTKRAGYAITDTVWTTTHATEETDIEKLEKELVVEDYESLPESIIKKIGEIS